METNELQTLYINTSIRVFPESLIVKVKDKEVTITIPNQSKEEVSTTQVDKEGTVQFELAKIIQNDLGHLDLTDNNYIITKDYENQEITCVDADNKETSMNIWDNEEQNFLHFKLMIPKVSEVRKQEHREEVKNFIIHLNSLQPALRQTNNEQTNTVHQFKEAKERLSEAL